MGIGNFVDDVLGLAPEIQKVADIDALEMLRTFRDELAGVEQVEVKNPDGSRSLISRRIPLSAEERARNQQIEEGLTSLLTEIDELNNIAVASQSARFKPIVDAQTALLTDELKEEQREAVKQQEEILAERGLSSSTAGIQTRAALQSDVNDAVTSIGQQGFLLGEQLRNDALNRSLQSLAPFTQQQNRDDILQQNALSRGSNLQLSIASQELARQQANLQNAQFNSSLAFKQSQAATNTGLNLLSGGFDAAAKASEGGGGFDLKTIASIGATLFSDMRLKENIELVASEKDINFYTYNYKGEEEVNMGVMAQEILSVLPEAVSEDQGYYKVNYAKVMEYLNG